MTKTLHDVIEAYRGTTLWAQKRHSTRRRMEISFEHLRPLHGRSIKTIVQPDISLIVYKLGPGAGRVLMDHVSALFRWAMDAGFIDRNPMSGLIRPKLGSIRPWTDEEYRRFIQGASRPLRLAAILSRHTGQRRSDILKMKWSDIMMRDGVKIIRVVQKKTGIRLDIPVSETLDQVLSLNDPGKGAYIVSNARGERFVEDSFTRRFHRERKALGLPDDLMFHGLRKTMAVKAAEGGASLKQVMALGGWKSAKTAMGYMEQADQFTLARGAVEKMG